MIPTLKRYVIEREIPGIGNMSREQFKQIAMTSCEASAKLYGKIQWEHSYVAGDKTFCVYLADGEASILEHARLGDFPANKITQALTVIDPMTAFS
jgi:Nickel responsive protein SCO4226-like